MSKDKKNTPPDIEWENRTLCQNESCIGVIGPDGRCKECGLALNGTLPDNAESADFDTVTDETPESSLDEPNDLESSSDSDWGDRQLCSDGNCIGVIGSDGLCKECGKP
ncbi:MAG: hypothetical protein JRH15_18260 [Deltaproteobacteria bacterium]|nr:hypothetical protein [Deltaproteobacteria bacterium]